MSDRKPAPISREPANTVLQRFIKEHNIRIGTRRSNIDYTDNGGIVISNPEVFAVYADEVGGEAN